MTETAEARYWRNRAERARAEIDHRAEQRPGTKAHSLALAELHHCEAEVQRLPRAGVHPQAGRFDNLAEIR